MSAVADRHWQARTAQLLGEDSLDKLAAASVAVVGLGGVGSFVVEALARAGVGRLVLIDGDVVDDPNRNRQLGALCSTIGQPKAAVLAARVRDIHPSCRVEAHTCYYLPPEARLSVGAPPDGGVGGEELLDGCGYVADAVDMVSAKVALAVQAQRRGFYLVSAMGCGNKIDPTRFVVGDVFETTVDPLCRVMRRELRRRGILRLRVVYSTEPPCPAVPPATGQRPVPGSLSTVPSVAGLILAGDIIHKITNS